MQLWPHLSCFVYAWRHGLQTCGEICRIKLIWGAKCDMLQEKQNAWKLFWDISDIWARVENVKRAQPASLVLCHVFFPSQKYILYFKTVTMYGPKSQMFLWNFIYNWNLQDRYTSKFKAKKEPGTVLVIVCPVLKFIFKISQKVKCNIYLHKTHKLRIYE